MARRRWNVELSDGPHTVELEHSWISGKREVWVDGQAVPLSGSERGSLVDFGGKSRVPVGDRTGVLHIRTNGLTYRYELSIDGRSVDTGHAVDEASAAVPWWGWMFVVACAAIPIATLGGGLTTALGVGGAMGCYAIARDPGRPVRRKVATCLAIVAACWALTVALVVAVASL